MGSHCMGGRCGGHGCGRNTGQLWKLSVDLVENLDGTFGCLLKVLESLSVLFIIGGMPVDIMMVSITFEM